MTVRISTELTLTYRCSPISCIKGKIVAYACLQSHKPPDGWNAAGPIRGYSPSSRREVVNLRLCNVDQIAWTPVFCSPLPTRAG